MWFHHLFQLPLQSSHKCVQFQKPFNQTKQPLCMAYEKSEHNEVQENDERIDNEFDRIYKHPLKNRKLKILYQEWLIGLVTWYNKVLEEYRIAFHDSTEDQINLSSGDGMEIILLLTFLKTALLIVCFWFCVWWLCNCVIFVSKSFMESLKTWKDLIGGWVVCQIRIVWSALCSKSSYTWSQTPPDYTFKSCISSE